MPDPEHVANVAKMDVKSLEEIYFRAVEALPDALVVINEGGEIVVFNQQAELMFGYARSQVIGQAVEVLLPETKRLAHPRQRGGWFDEPRVREMGIGLVLSGRHRSGKEFQVRIKLSPLVTEGSGICGMAVVRRVTPEPTYLKTMTEEACKP